MLLRDLFADVLVAVVGGRAADSDDAVDGRRRPGKRRHAGGGGGGVGRCDSGGGRYQIVHFQIRVGQDVLQQLLVHGVPLQHLFYL